MFVRAAALHAAVALVGCGVAALFFGGSLEAVGTHLSDPLVVRAAAFYVVLASALGAGTARMACSPHVSRRVLRAVLVGVVIHPLALSAFAISARVVPFGPEALAGSIVDDLRSALGFSVGAVLFGSWVAIPAAWVAGELTHYRSTPPS